jgi:hypothetical protein
MHLIEIHVYPHIEPKHHILNETELNIAEIHFIELHLKNPIKCGGLVQSGHYHHLI